MMGRPTTWQAVFHQTFEKVYRTDLDADLAADQATIVADAARQAQWDHRRKRNAEYQRRHRIKKQAEQGRQLGDITISIRLTKETLAVLDAEVSATQPDMILEHGRSVVLASLIAPLAGKQRESTVNSEEKPRLFSKIEEENIYALQMLIASSRQKGIPDDEILEHVRKSTTMSLDEIMGYQLLTVTIP